MKSTKVYQSVISVFTNKNITLIGLSIYSAAEVLLFLCGYKPEKEELHNQEY